MIGTAQCMARTAKRIVWAVVAAAAALYALPTQAAECEKQVYPPVNAPRLHSSFNRNWAFHLGDLPNGASPSLDDSAWRKLDLPHDWSIEGDFAQSNLSGASGGFLPGGIGLWAT
jgi:hypothetical protein